MNHQVENHGTPPGAVGEVEMTINRMVCLARELSPYARVLAYRDVEILLGLVRAAALEEAAAICDLQAVEGSPGRDHWDVGWECGAEHLADAIRSIK